MGDLRWPLCPGARHAWAAQLTAPPSRLTPSGQVTGVTAGTKSAVVSCSAANPATAGDFKLTVTTAASCSKDDTVAATVKAKPTVDVANSVVRSARRAARGGAMHCQCIPNHSAQACSCRRVGIYPLAVLPQLAWEVAKRFDRMHCSRLHVCTPFRPRSSQPSPLWRPQRYCPFDANVPITFTAGLDTTGMASDTFTATVALSAGSFSASASCTITCATGGTCPSGWSPVTCNSGTSCTTGALLGRQRPYRVLGAQVALVLLQRCWEGGPLTCLVCACLRTACIMGPRWHRGPMKPIA